MTEYPNQNSSPQGPPSFGRDVWRKHMNNAMRGGLYVGLAFATTAISWLFFRLPLLQGLLGLVGFVMVPILLILIAIRYRDNELGGRITYMRAVGFMSWTLLFGIIISIIAYFIVFTILFRNPDFLALMEKAFDQFLILVQDKEMKDLYREVIQTITPKTISLNLAIYQLLFGLIFMYIAALFVRR